MRKEQMKGGTRRDGREEVPEVKDVAMEKQTRQLPESQLSTKQTSRPTATQAWDSCDGSRLSITHGTEDLPYPGSSEAAFCSPL